tara:strand:- start:103 stop:258 length:156 start_codon:yes stop_codon:yes gene_type:complete
MKKNPAPVAVVFVRVNVQIAKNVHLVKIINHPNQINNKLIFGKVPKTRTIN